MSNSANKQKASNKNPFKSSRRSVIFDKVHPKDFNQLNMIYYCEQCSHYDFDNDRCTIGYESSIHAKAFQDKMYELSGRVAFCRFCEID